MKKYLNVAYYQVVPREDYTGVVDQCEPTNMPTMRQIVERFVQGLDYNDGSGSYYDDEPDVMDGHVDLFDLMDEKRIIDQRIYLDRKKEEIRSEDQVLASPSQGDQDGPDEKSSDKA